MRVSLQWLRELVPFSCDPTALAEKLSMAGFEVEADEDLSLRANGVVCGRVERKTAHPDATKLNICDVSIGASAPLQIVCGASNVREGMAVAVATIGSYLPAIKLDIKPAKLRGVDSCGMLCSLAELGLDTDVDGIADLEQIALSSAQKLPQLGQPVGPLLGLDDRIFELAITANRADGLSMLGLAREVAALEQLAVVFPEVSKGSKAENLESESLFEFSELFSLTALENVQVAASPLWLQRRLEGAGQRSINNVVDITNLVMLETGQPLHAYDSNMVGEAACFALRLAKPGEVFKCLDGIERKLTSENLLVTEQDIPVAIAGVMGGEASSVQLQTKGILLEAAVFSAPQVRRSSRAASLRSESSARFERGVAKANCLAAADRAVDLLQEICGAKATRRWVAAKNKEEIEPIVFRRSALEKLLGPLDGGDSGYEEINSEDVVNILESLGCNVRSEGEAQAESEIWHVLVPPARQGDLKREVDLIEEVARLVGYDRFCSHLPDPLEPGGLSAQEELQRRLCSALRAAGLQELTHLSLVPKDTNSNNEQVELSNPLLADYGNLRTNLSDGLLLAASRNLQSPQPGFWGFEIGTVFRKIDNNYAETIRLTGIICGHKGSELWSNSGQMINPNYYKSRGVIAQAFREIGLELQDKTYNGEPQLHPGRAASLYLNGKVVGIFGEIHPELADNHKLPSGCCLFDFELEQLLTAASANKLFSPVFKAYPTVPASERDLAFVVSETIEANLILGSMRKWGGSLLENVQLLDRYTGAQVDPGFCSIAVRLRFRAEDCTLRDEQVEAPMLNIIELLQKTFNAKLRV